MNKYLKEFFKRGLMFSGFGPIVMAIIYLFVDMGLDSFALSSSELFTAIISTYILAFLHAGASVFNSIEHWSLLKSTACHFLSLYFAYSFCYVVNSWIPFIPEILLIFTIVFIAVYIIVWLIVYILIKATAKKLNSKI